MTRGFLLVDGQKNTIILPADDPDLAEFMRYKPNEKNVLEKAHQHKTLKELDADIRAYLEGKYDG